MKPHGGHTEAAQLKSAEVSLGELTRSTVGLFGKPGESEIRISGRDRQEWPRQVQSLLCVCLVPGARCPQ
jgi:hypothetical protein